MNSYSAIFIPKINNKLKKIIKGIELLNLINNKINIQTGGSSVAEALGNLLNGTIYIYNTEDYEKEYKKMVAKFLKEIALLRAIIIELLSRLPQKDKEKLIPITDDKLDARIENAATTIQKAFKEHKKPTKMPADDITPDFTFGNIKIYILTKDNYKSILQLSGNTQWYRDIDSNTPIYTSDNIVNIYIIHIIKNDTIIPFLVSFKNNDLRDINNKQLKLYEFYNNIQTITNNEDNTKLRKWFTTSVEDHVGKKPIVLQSTAYNADSCVRYNIIYRTTQTFNLTKLTIHDKGTEYDNTTKTFGSVPFYIDIYEFINKFTTVVTLHIIGNFNIHFYNKEPSISQTFSKIKTLICENIYIFKLLSIIKLFINITDITIKYKYTYTTVFLRLNNETESNSSQLIKLFNYLQENKKIQTISLSKLFKLDNITQHEPAIVERITQFETYIKTNKKVLTYID